MRILTASAALAGVSFGVWDALDVASLGQTFRTILDSGLYHVLPEDRIQEFSRQVHRVLKPNAALVFSTNHPAAHLIDTDADEPLLVRHSYWDHAPMEWEWNGTPFRDFHHTIQDVFTSLIRANFRIDTIIEPEPVPSGARSMFWDETQTLVPRYLIIRARKEGT